jgi:hypothetical protein
MRRGNVRHDRDDHPFGEELRETLPRKQILVTAFGALAIVGIGWAKGGPVSVAGVLVGILVALSGIVSLWIVVRLLSSNQPHPKQGAFMVVLAGILKLPVLAAGIYLGVSLPGVGLPCFLTAIGLVYCVVIWLLVERQQAPEPIEK